MQNEDLVPIVVQCLSSEASSSSTATSPTTSSSQDSSRENFSQRPVKRRTKQQRSLARGNSSRDLEAKECDNLARNLPEWVEASAENLVDGEAAASSTEAAGSSEPHLSVQSSQRGV